LSLDRLSALTPGVWYFYVAYCLFMAILYLAVVGLGILFIMAAETIAAGTANVLRPR
jgi:hypothetical protein